MIKKHLTCKTYLKSFDDYKIVARLDTKDPDISNIFVTEPDETLHLEHNNRFLQMSSDRHYLVGEIAEKLYAYEQLGYSPEELKEIIARYGFDKAKKDYDDLIRKHMYITTARCNGKSSRATQLLLEHCLKHDIDPISSLYPSMMIVPRTPVPEIKKVIFNDPATIVLWADGTKTIVKATNEEFDPEKGLAMAITKKVLGNKGKYFETIKKWTKED